MVLGDVLHRLVRRIMLAPVRQIRNGLRFALKRPMVITRKAFQRVERLECYVSDVY